jgi:tetratricopeptide (TPR) repeat protein
MWRAVGYAPTLLQFSADSNVARDYAQAEAWAAFAVQVDPSNPQAWLRLGRAQNAQDRTEQALATFTSAVERFPELSAAYEELAGVLFQTKEYARAGDVLARAFEQAQLPGAHLYYLRSRLAAREEDYTSAERDALQALALSPDNGGYLAWLGDLYLTLGWEDKALAQYRSAMQRGGPVWAWRARQRIGSLYARQGLYVDAVVEYRAALRISQEQDAPAVTLAQNQAALGDVLAQAGQPEAARLAYEQALKLDPHNEQVRINLGALAVP